MTLLTHLKDSLLSMCFYLTSASICISLNEVNTLWVYAITIKWSIFYKVSRHDTLSSQWILTQESHNALCRACFAAQCDTHVMTCTTCTSRQTWQLRHVFGGIATTDTGVDMSTSLFLSSCVGNFKSKWIHYLKTAHSHQMKLTCHQITARALAWRYVESCPHFQNIKKTAKQEWSVDRCTLTWKLQQPSRTLRSSSCHWWGLFDSTFMSRFLRILNVRFKRSIAVVVVLLCTITCTTSTLCHANTYIYTC